MSPDIFWWGGGLPRERVGAKKFGMSLETQGIKLFGRDIPGFCRDIPEAPEKFEKKVFGFNFRSFLKVCVLSYDHLAAHPIYVRFLLPSIVLGWHVCRTKLPQKFFSRHEFSHEKCSKCSETRQMLRKFRAFILWIRKHPAKLPPKFLANFPSKNLKKIHRRASSGAQGEHSDFLHLFRKPHSLREILKTHVFVDIVTPFRMLQLAREGDGTEAYVSPFCKTSEETCHPSMEKEG